MFPFVLVLVLLLPAHDTVVKLGDKNFFVREKAQKEIIMKMDLDTYRYLKMYKTRDPEVVRRIEIILALYERKIMSEYQVDLKGYKDYPFIDEGMPMDYTLDFGPCKGLVKGYIILHYLQKAGSIRLPADYPHQYMNHRRATKILMEERIAWYVEESMNHAKNEREFRAAMQRKMGIMQKDIEMLIEGDRDFYKRRKQTNPFEREVQIKK